MWLSEKQRRRFDLKLPGRGKRIPLSAAVSVLFVTEVYFCSLKSMSIVSIMMGFSYNLDCKAPVRYRLEQGFIIGDYICLFLLDSLLSRRV